MNIRTYSRKETIVFRKTREEFGGLSNMATGFPLKVNGLRIFTSEALYQACRFPHLPELQRVIIGQRSPMTAKMKSKPHRGETRADWNRVKVKIMRWCLRVKLAQNWTKFSQLLLETGDRPIVEESRRDDFWGAKVIDGQTLRGFNVLGRLLMELRKQLKQGDRESLSIVEPLAIPDFLLDGRAIGTIFGRVDEVIYARNSLEAKTRVSVNTFQRSDASPMLRPAQGLLFESPNSIATKLTSGLGKNNKLKPYPVYKDSGVSWLGKIPDHWRVLPNRSAFKEIQEKGHPDEEMLSVTITQGVIKQALLLRDTSKKDSSKEDKSKYKLVCPGDIAYNKMRAWQGAVGVSGYRGIVSPAYIVIRPRESQNPRYFHYLFRTPVFTKEAERWSYGISSDQWSLRPEEFRQIYCCVPPSIEQGAIVRYLEYIDKRIRLCINGKKKLIGLLKEQKRAVIHQAVTRGPDPNVHLGSSGVDWLEDIPEHWEVRRLRTIVHALVSNVDKHTKEEETCIRLCNYTDVYKNERITQNLAFMSASASEEEIAYFALRLGDVIITKDSEDWNDIGVPSLVEYMADDLVCGYHLAILRPRAGILGEYLLRALQSPIIASQFYVAANGVTRYGLSHVAIRNVLIPVPSLPEQNAIIRFINDAVENLDAATNRAQHEINLLREYRSRLISDVVTGKLDVREAAASLPEEAEQPEDIEELTDSEGMPEEVALEPAIAEATDED
ncbi:MAG: NADAR domain-containing protein [Dehalococcoidia bacterium]